MLAVLEIIITAGRMQILTLLSLKTSGFTLQLLLKVGEQLNFMLMELLRQKQQLSRALDIIPLKKCGLVGRHIYPAYFTGYMNDVAMYQTAKYTSNFTPTTTGLLNSQPSIPAAVSPGTVSPNGNVSATNFNPFNTDIKTVLGQETGYATWNPLKMGTSDTSMSEGNLFWRTTSNGPDRCTYSTIGMDSGKWYWENEIVEATATGCWHC